MTTPESDAVQVLTRIRDSIGDVASQWAQAKILLERVCKFGWYGGYPSQDIRQLVTRIEAGDTGGMFGGVGSNGAREITGLLLQIRDSKIVTGGGVPVVQTLTNAQKLSLPPNTPVGTEVIVTDWETAGLAGAHQRLTSPSTAQGGAFISGIDASSAGGIWTPSGTNEGKASYAHLGIGDDSIIWTVAGNAGAGWYVSLGGGDPLFYSLSDVATPDLASNWKNAADNTSASITVASVSQGELNAGVKVTGAGTSNPDGGGSGLVEVDGSYSARSSFGGRVTYNMIGAASSTVINGNGAGAPPLCIYWGASDTNQWRIADSEDAGAFIDTIQTNSAFPWNAHWDANDSLPPAPTVTRNDVASEANWEVIP